MYLDDDLNHYSCASNHSSYKSFFFLQTRYPIKGSANSRTLAGIGTMFGVWTIDYNPLDNLEQFHFVGQITH